jgi:hypothetical protein
VTFGCFYHVTSDFIQRNPSKDLETLHVLKKATANDVSGSALAHHR